MNEASREDRVLKVVGVKFGETVIFIPLDDGHDLLELVHEIAQHQEISLRCTTSERSRALGTDD